MTDLRGGTDTIRPGRRWARGRLLNGRLRRWPSFAALPGRGHRVGLQALALLLPAFGGRLRVEEQRKVEVGLAADDAEVEGDAAPPPGVLAGLGDGGAVVDVVPAPLA